MLQKKKYTIPSVVRDFTEWHRGRKEFGLWMIGLEHDAILEKVRAARSHLSGYLLEPYERQPHITLFVCGFLAESRRHDDDYDGRQFDDHCRLLADSGIAPFSVEVNGLNSFASAPYLEVHDREGGIAQVRRILSPGSTDSGQADFTPHVTIGLYSGRFESRAVVERISAFPHPPVTLSVDRITFASYNPSHIAGPLLPKKQVVLQGAEDAC